MSPRFDVAILGSGFGGSILATILASQGQRVALIDRKKHPRFAIGESSTPLADGLLRWLGETYGKTSWVQLSTYGSWKADHPYLACGLKRGFAYFQHSTPEGVEIGNLDRQSLLVAASASDASGDTHWYRPDVDHFFFNQAIAAGSTELIGHEVTDIRPGTPHRLTLSRAGTDEETTVDADTIIDATGRAGVTGKLLPAVHLTNRMKTNTRSVYAHYRGITSFVDQLRRRGYDSANDPFHGDCAAVHHLIAGGWLWNLRFDNEITSVGFTAADRDNMPSIDEVIGQSSDLAEVFRQSNCIVPATTTGRLQRWIDPVIADRIWMLPATAVTLDPMHSTGIAMQLAGVARIAAHLSHPNADTKFFETAYARTIELEAQLLDELVSTSYAVMSDFERFTLACMLFFVAAIASEERLITEGFDAGQPLYEASHSNLTGVLIACCAELRSTASTATIQTKLASAISPFNTAGLINPNCGNRYAYTATK